MVKVKIGSEGVIEGIELEFKKDETFNLEKCVDFDPDPNRFQLKSRLSYSCLNWLKNRNREIANLHVQAFLTAIKSIPLKEGRFIHIYEIFDPVVNVENSVTEFASSKNYVG